MLNRLKMRVQYCRRLQPQDEGYMEGMNLFYPPVTRWLNVLPISGETTLASGGELTEQYLKARLPAGNPEKYFEKDQLYIRKNPPAEFDPADPQCDFEVRSSLPGHNVTELILKRLVNE